jgi:hypothetical protein
MLTYADVCLLSQTGALSSTQQEEDEADEDGDADGQVLSLLALLVEKYKY